MKIGIVGYQGSGKSTLFEWLTGVASDPAQSHVGQSAMAAVPDDRVEPLCALYHPKKVTLASLELVDTPGLSRSHEGNAARLAMLREAGCLLLVVAAFDGTDPLADMTRFQDDLLLADLAIVSGRVERLRESVKKPRPNRDQERAELAALEPLVEQLEAGEPIHDDDLNDEQQRAVRSFGLLTKKPCLVVINVADDEEDPARWETEAAARTDQPQQVVAVPIGLQLELARMEAAERDELVAEMGLVVCDRDALLRRILDVSGQMLFFTAGEKEVRTWMIRKGSTAQEAAGGIHTDMARGFIRAEVMSVRDLLRVGSEREMKAQHLVRQEPKDYIVQDDDILLIRFSV